MPLVAEHIRRRRANLGPYACGGRALGGAAPPTCEMGIRRLQLLMHHLSVDHQRAVSVFFEHTFSAPPGTGYSHRAGLSFVDEVDDTAHFEVAPCRVFEILQAHEEKGPPAAHPEAPAEVNIRGVCDHAPPVLSYLDRGGSPSVAPCRVQRVHR